MKIGYARTSTVEQNYSLEDQIEKLEQMGAKRYSANKSVLSKNDPNSKPVLSSQEKVMWLSSLNWIDLPDLSLTFGNTSPYWKKKVCLYTYWTSTLIHQHPMDDYKSPFWVESHSGKEK